jgi:hypothetical protein
MTLLVDSNKIYFPPLPTFFPFSRTFLTLTLLLPLIRTWIWMNLLIGKRSSKTCTSVIYYAHPSAILVCVLINKHENNILRSHKYAIHILQ